MKEGLKEQTQLEKAKFECDYVHGWMINLLGLVITSALGYSAIPDSETTLKIAIGIGGILFAIAYFAYTFAENKKYKAVTKIYNKIIKLNSK